MNEQIVLRADLRQRLQQLKPESADAPASPEELFSYVSALQGEVYRHVKGRRTLRFELGGRWYFLKWHDGVGWREIFKNLVSGRLPIVGAHPEYRAIKRFHEVGLPTMQVAGFGRRGNNPARQQSFLITDDLSPTISLEDLCADWPRQRPHFAFKLALIRAVADIARNMHHHGMAHRDFYLCHFLLGTEHPADVESDAPRLNVIDLHRVLIRRHLPQRWAIKDIGGLYSSALDIGLTRTDYARFVRWYTGLSLRDALVGKAPFWSRVRKRASHIKWRDQRKAVDRALRGIYRSSDTQHRLQDFGKLVVLKRRYNGPELRAFLGRPDQHMQQGRMIKDGDSTTVVQLTLDGREYVIKRYNLRNFWYGLRRLFRRSRASHCWRSAHLLELAGIDTPVPVMMLELRWGPFRRRAYYITEHRAEPLVGADRGVAAPETLATLLDDLLTRMLRFRIVHGDMKITNFLQGDQQLVVLDLDATRRVRGAGRFAALFDKDLRRLLANWQGNDPEALHARQAMMPVVTRASSAQRKQL